MTDVTVRVMAGELLPGEELVRRGAEDLAAGVESVEALRRRRRSRRA